MQFIVDALFNILGEGSVQYGTLTTRVPVHCLRCVMVSHTVQIIYNSAAIKIFSMFDLCAQKIICFRYSGDWMNCCNSSS